MQIQQDGMNHSILTAKSWSVIFSPCFLLSFLVTKLYLNCGPRTNSSRNIS